MKNDDQRTLTPRLREVESGTVDAMIATVPREWDVSDQVRLAWSELICRRAGFTADHVQNWIERDVSWFATPGD